MDYSKVTLVEYEKRKKEVFDASYTAENGMIAWTQVKLYKKGDK